MFKWDENKKEYVFICTDVPLRTKSLSQIAAAIDQKIQERNVREKLKKVNRKKL